MLEEIVKELENSSDGSTIPLTRVRQWMASEEIDVLGATLAFLYSPTHVQRVVPSLSFEEVFYFELRYYEICMANDFQSEWAHSPYIAGADLVLLFVRMWDEERRIDYFQAIKAMLERLYLAGTPYVKKVVEHAVIEHLFEREPIRQFFNDWRENPELRPAFDEGMLWVEGGGTSPLTQRRPQS